MVLLARSPFNSSIRNISEGLNIAESMNITAEKQHLSAGSIVGLTAIAVVIIFLNGVVCYLIYRNKNLRTYTCGFIVSLSLSDILIGGVLLPVYIFFPGPQMNGYITAICLNINVSSITAVTFDRYISITYPLKYENFFMKNFRRILVLSWLLPFLVSLLPLAWGTQTSSTEHNVYLISCLIVCVLMPYMFIIYAYTKIFKEVSRQMNRLCVGTLTVDNGVALQYTCAITSTDASKPVYPGKRRSTIQKVFKLKKLKELDGEKRVCTIFLIIALVFALGWFPIIYMTFCSIFNEDNIIPSSLPVISVFTLSLSSICNVFLYSILNPDVRGTALKTIPCFTRLLSFNLNTPNSSPHIDPAMIARRQSSITNTISQVTEL